MPLVCKRTRMPLFGPQKPGQSRNTVCRESSTMYYHRRGCSQANLQLGDRLCYCRVTAGAKCLLTFRSYRPTDPILWAAHAQTPLRVSLLSCACQQMHKQILEFASSQLLFQLHLQTTHRPGFELCQPSQENQAEQTLSCSMLADQSDAACSQLDQHNARLLHSARPSQQQHTAIYAQGPHACWALLMKSTMHRTLCSKSSSRSHTGRSLRCRRSAGACSAG